MGYQIVLIIVARRMGVVKEEKSSFSVRISYATVGEGQDPPGDFVKQNHAAEGGIPLFPFGKSQNCVAILGGRVKTLPYRVGT